MGQGPIRLPTVNDLADHGHLRNSPATRWEWLDKLVGRQAITGRLRDGRQAPTAIKRGRSHQPRGGFGGLHPLSMKLGLSVADYIAGRKQETLKPPAGFLGRVLLSSYRWKMALSTDDGRTQPPRTPAGDSTN
jgi:hypothetical protein